MKTWGDREHIGELFGWRRGKANPYHEPAGTPEGGQFAEAPNGASDNYSPLYSGETSSEKQQLYLKDLIENHKTNWEKFKTGRTAPLKDVFGKTAYSAVKQEFPEPDENDYEVGDYTTDINAYLQADALKWAAGIDISKVGKSQASDLIDRMKGNGVHTAYIDIVHKGKEAEYLKSLLLRARASKK